MKLIGYFVQSCLTLVLAFFFVLYVTCLIFLSPFGFLIAAVYEHFTHERLSFLDDFLSHGKA